MTAGESSGNKLWQWTISLRWLRTSRRTSLTAWRDQIARVPSFTALKP
jgi:hypothetical protein